MVSVIVPVFNRMEYLPQCFDSILEQSYKDLELLIVDDGSGSDCSFFCDEYSKKDNRIKVIHKGNGGPADARNIGIQCSKGEYISFIDSDDLVHKDFFAIHMQNIKKFDSDISTCTYRKFHGNYTDKSINPNYPTCYSNKEAIANLFGQKYKQFVIVCNKVFRRECFDSISFPRNKRYEDEFIMYKLLYSAKNVAYTNTCLYYYRQHSDSTMGRPVSFEILDICEAYSDMQAFFSDLGETELYLGALSKYSDILRYFHYRAGESSVKSILYEKFRIVRELLSINNFNNSFLKNIAMRLFLEAPDIHDLLFFLAELRFRSLNPRANWISS